MQRRIMLSMGMLRFIVVALMGGVIAFAGFALVFDLGRVAPLKPKTAGPPDTFLLFVFGVWGATLIAVFLVTGLKTRMLRRGWGSSVSHPDPVGELRPAWVNIVILRSALLEGPALLGAMVYHMIGDPLALVAPAANLVLLAFLFPTRSGLESFVERVTGARVPYGDERR